MTESEELWRLLAWLEQIQPPFATPQGIYPTFTYKILLAELAAAGGETKTALLDLAKKALEASQAHLLAAIGEQVDRAGEGMENQAEELGDTLDTALDGIAENRETETRRPIQILEELRQTVRVPFRLEGNMLTELAEDPRSLAKELRAQVEEAVRSASLSRLITTVEFRIGESLGLNQAELAALEWDEAANRIEERAVQVLEGREEKLLGADGQIVRDLSAVMERVTGRNEQSLIRLLAAMAQGASTTFDAKTHRQVRQIFTRLQYAHLAGELLAGRPSEEFEQQVLEHLQQAQEAQRAAWGQSELTRLGEAAGSLSAGEMGRRVQNQIYRQVLLGAISELWVEYLTRVEALRVSIGLEAYAQSDPLVKYKSKASEMFQALLADIRAGVIGRIFLYQPKQAATVPVEVPTAERTGAGTSAPAETAAPQGGDKKRKRHRH